MYYMQEVAQNNKADPGPRGGGGGQAQISGLKIKYIGCKKSYQPPNAVEQQHFWSPYTALGTVIILLP